MPSCRKYKITWTDAKGGESVATGLQRDYTLRQVPKGVDMVWVSVRDGGRSRTGYSAAYLLRRNKAGGWGLVK